MSNSDFATEMEEVLRKVGTVDRQLALYTLIRETQAESADPWTTAEKAMGELQQLNARDRQVLLQAWQNSPAAEVSHSLLEMSGINGGKAHLTIDLLSVVASRQDIRWRSGVLIICPNDAVMEATVRAVCTGVENAKIDLMSEGDALAEDPEIKKRISKHKTIVLLPGQSPTAERKLREGVMERLGAAQQIWAHIPMTLLEGRRSGPDKERKWWKEHHIAIDRCYAWPEGSGYGVAAKNTCLCRWMSGTDAADGLAGVVVEDLSIKSEVRVKSDQVYRGDGRVGMTLSLRELITGKPVIGRKNQKVENVDGIVCKITRQSVNGDMVRAKLWIELPECSVNLSPNGKCDYTYINYRQDESDLQTILRNQIRKRCQNHANELQGWLEEENLKLKLGTFVMAFFDQIAVEAMWGKRAEKYFDFWVKHLEQYWGNYLIADIDEAKMLTWIKAPYQEIPYEERRGLRKVFEDILRQARIAGQLTQQPITAKVRRLVESQRGKILEQLAQRALSIDKQIEIAQACIRNGTHLGAAVLLRLATGMKPDEICALECGDIRQDELGGLQIWVTKRRHQVRYRPPEETECMLEDANQYRRIPVTPALEQVLREEFALELPCAAEMRNRPLLTVSGAAIESNDIKTYTDEILEHVLEKGIQIFWDESGEETQIDLRTRGDLLRNNAASAMYHVARMTQDECCVLLGIEPITTFGCNYCDWFAVTSQARMRVELETWHDQILAAAGKNDGSRPGHRTMILASGRVACDSRLSITCPGGVRGRAEMRKPKN